MRKIILSILVCTISGCSMLPATSTRFVLSLKSEIGNKERGFWGQKIITKGKTKEWYFSYYNSYSDLECKYIKITDLNDIIVGYRVLTPKACRLKPPTLGL